MQRLQRQVQIILSLVLIEERTVIMRRGGSIERVSEKGELTIVNMPTMDLRTSEVPITSVGAMKST